MHMHTGQNMKGRGQRTSVARGPTRSLHAMRDKRLCFELAAVSSVCLAVLLQSSKVGAVLDYPVGVSQQVDRFL